MAGDLERTEAPSDKRIQKAREEGRVPHSRELSTFIGLLFATGTFWAMGDWFFNRAKMVIKTGLTFSPKILKDPFDMLTVLGQFSMDALLTCAPLFIVLIIAAIIPSLLLNSFIFSTKNLLPDFTKLNPLAGIKRMVSMQSLVELGKSIIKFLVLGGICFSYIYSQKEEVIGILNEDFLAGINHGGHIILTGFTICVATLILVVIFDVPYQLWQYYSNLKMTLEEVKQENKEMAGNPQVKGRIRSLQIAASRRRMAAAIPNADVIVTNPTHYAVAISYKEGMSAPLVLAKGTDELAKKIREIGKENGIPLVESPPLARALYNFTKVDEQIPPALYQAVAEILSYVLQLDMWSRKGGKHPKMPNNLDVPKEMSDPEKKD